MRKILFLIFIFLPAYGWATEEEKFKTCEQSAYELYPEPNYKPRFGTYGSRDPGRFSQNYQDALPTLADTESAKQKRQQYIQECIARE